MRKPMTRAQQRLFQVRKAYDSAHLEINNEYRKRYIQTARELGVALPTSLKEHVAMPAHFHEAMKDHQKACVGAIMLAQEAQRSSARETKPIAQAIRAGR